MQTVAAQVSNARTMATCQADKLAAEGRASAEGTGTHFDCPNAPLTVLNVGDCGDVCVCDVYLPVCVMVTVALLCEYLPVYVWCMCFLYERYICVCVYVCT